MKKLLNLILPIVLIFVSGCDAKLNVLIKDNDVVVSNMFILDKTQINDSIYYTVDRIAGKYFLSADFLLGDTKEYYKGNNAIYVKTEKYNLNDFNNSNLFSFCYDAHNIIIDDNSIFITTSDKFKCYDIYKELDSFDVVLKTNHKLIETNADEVNGYIYTWHINKKDANNESIKIKLYKDKYVFNYNNEFVIKVAIILVALLTILVIVFIIRRKVKKANKI